MALRLLYLIIRDIRVVLTAPQAPRMNAIMERWVGGVAGAENLIHVV